MHTHMIWCVVCIEGYMYARTHAVGCVVNYEILFMHTHMIWCVMCMEEFMYARTYAIWCVMSAAGSLHEKVEKSFHIAIGHIPLPYPSYLRGAIK
jgi:hypothetical protein